MPTREPSTAQGVGTRPADGERSAVVGFSGQYGLAARLIRAKITTLEWIRVADPAAGAADDFQFQAGGTRHAVQVKWAQYPGTFGWAELVNKTKAADPLLGRLAEARARLRTSWAGALEVRLWSNENASAAPPAAGSPLAECTADGPRHFAAFLARSWRPVQELLRDGAARWADAAALPEVAQWLPAWDALRAASGTHDDDDFVGLVRDLVLHFGPAVEDRLLRPDEAPTDPDVAHLAATLQALVADPARPLELSRAELVDRLGWNDRLRFRNPHAFPVPALYASNASAKQRLQARLDELAGGYVALVGPAGAGKSTLLAALSWPGRRTVRYYAFVPDASDPLSGRGEADSFLHDVSLALEGVGFRRSGHANDLRTRHSVLRDQLSDAGELYRTTGEATVIVVDGLDQIPREQNPTRSLLEELPAPGALPDGVFVVLGTQTTSVLPAPVEEALTADDRTVDLPPLSRDEVLRLADAAGPGSWLLPGQRDSLVAASEGHALALTYLLQDLSELAADPDPDARGLAVDATLAEANVYGRHVEARYRGYLRAVGDDPALVDLVAAVARLRAPVDIDWLKSWTEPAVLDEFVERTSTLFRREGTVWRFVHNSFRRFLVEETANVAGIFDAGRDQALHAALADVCGASPQQWALYRDEELAHRYLAGEHARVIGLATPPALRAKLFGLRPAAVVQDQTNIALRAAAATGDHSGLLRMLLFRNELLQREMVLGGDKVASAMADLALPGRAVEHVVAAGRLRIPAPLALELAAGHSRAGRFDAAGEILRAAGNLGDIVREHSQCGGDWAEAVFSMSGLADVLARIDDQIPLPAPPQGDGEGQRDGDGDGGNATADDDAAWAAERRRRDRAEHDARIVAARTAAFARCLELLSDLRDDAGIAQVMGRIDGESSSGWRARARVVLAAAARDDADTSAVVRLAREIADLHAQERDELDDEEDESPPGAAGGVPLQLRVAAAEVLVDVGLADAAEFEALVPATAAAAWPTVPSGQDGLEPFRTFLDLAALRVAVAGPARPDATAAAAGKPATGRPTRDMGRRRFRAALTALAELEGRHISSNSGRGSPPDVAAGADLIVRLYEVDAVQTRDWTAWYYVRESAAGLYDRVFRLAAASSQDAPGQLLGRFEAAWDDPDRARYWPPQQRIKVLRAALRFSSHGVGGRIRQRLETASHEIHALHAGPHELAEAWLDMAGGWNAAGNPDKAEQALARAVEASWAPGVHQDDRQLSAWLGWLGAAADGAVLPPDQVVEAARDYASRLVSAHDAEQDVAEAVDGLVRLVWPRDPALAAALAEWLCDAGAADEDQAVEAVLTAAAEDPSVPAALAAAAAAELLVPLRRDRPDAFRDVLAGRGEADVPSALLALDGAVELWSVREDRPGGSTAGEAAPPQAAAAGGPDADEPAPLPANAGALLATMRAADPADGAALARCHEAASRIGAHAVAGPVAEALLDQAVRLRLGGEALGGLAALAARAGRPAAARTAVADALARTPAYGWLRHYDGGSRLELLQAAVADRNPTLVSLAADDLAGALSTGAIGGHLFPADLRRIVTLVAGDDAVAHAWPHVHEHLDVYAPARPGADVPPPSDPTAPPVEALLGWVATYLGHPVRPRDFGARRVLAYSRARPEQAVRDAADGVLARAVAAGGWKAEAALHGLVVAPPPHPPPSAPLAAEIAASAARADSICRALARRVAARHGLPTHSPTERPLPGPYRLVLPPLPRRTAPDLDGEGVPILDTADPQHVLAPFDVALRMAAAIAGLPEAAVLHRAAALTTDGWSPWLDGGHRGQARRLRLRGQRHTYRPWALLKGRRALSAVLAELDDARALPPAADPAHALELVDEALGRIVPAVLDGTTPLPWRDPSASDYDTRGWCAETVNAAAAYSTTTTAAAAYVLAERTEWRHLGWEQARELRTVRARHRTGGRSGLALPDRDAWEATRGPATRYPALTDLSWNDEQLIVDAWEPHTDAPWACWLAFHPAAAGRLGWTPDPTEPLRWNGPDGHPRAATVRRARGQLSHPPPGHAYVAAGWQVVLTAAGLSELKAAVGPLSRDVTVERTLPARPRDERPDAQTATATAPIPEPP